MAPNASDSGSKDGIHVVKEKDRKKKHSGSGGGTSKSKSRDANLQAAHFCNASTTTPTTPSTHKNIRSSPKSTPKQSPQVILSSFYSNNSTPISVGSVRSLNFDMLFFHKDIELAIQSNQWDSVRMHIQQINQNSLNSLSIDSLDSSGRKGSRISFWNRISGLRNGAATGTSATGTSNDYGSTNSHDRLGLLMMDDEQRTPLHLVVSCRKVPVDIVQLMVALEPRAVSLPNNCGRLPLHFAIVHRADISVIAALIDAFPAAISFPDSKGQSPLQYAVDIARRDSMKGPQPPRTYWMPLPDCCDEAIWQHEQTERWSVVHWLLLSSATHLQTSLSVGGRKPILVEALISAASPAVISLLIGASVMLLSHENKATAFAASTLYTCITRHYPLTILRSLANQCPSDVHEVRDETGMGLVSAQFISACFEQISNTLELGVSEDFYACFTECIQENEIGADPVMVDWWRKIEYLIAFCACSKHNRSGTKGVRRKNSSTKKLDPNNFPSEYLLHAALMNDDTPPPVIRLLLALYPKSIKYEDPKSAALPLHLCAMKQDYIPRYYETNTTGNDTTMNIILSADPSAILKRHDGRLPLHYAIESGRPITSLKSLLNATISHSLEIDEIVRQPPLLQRDPITHLYPFLMAASYPNNSEEDSLRWTSIARNKHSNTAWKALSDRQKACTILRVAELENIARIDTIYELLRRQPEAICNGLAHHTHCRPDKTKLLDGSANFLARDSTGKGVIAEHYISWCYLKKLGKAREEVYEDNVQNQHIFRHAIDDIRRTGNLSSAPRDIQVWWEQLTKLMRQLFIAEMQQHDYDWVNIPYEKSEFLLHVALTHSDTPPPVIDMILAYNSNAASLCIPTTTFLPLHIAVQTPSYIPRNFEHHEECTLGLILTAYPDAVRETNNNRFPLHMAILSGKPYQDIRMLVCAEPTALRCIDDVNKLYPFQMKASCTKYTSLQRSSFLYVARNKYDESSWNQLTPQMRTNQVMQVQKDYDLDGLSTIFMLLRKDPSVVKQTLTTFTSFENPPPNRLKSLCSTLTSKSKESDTSTNNKNAIEDSSFVLKSEECSSPVAKTKNQLPLMLLLSHHISRHKEMFECDASVMSNIDIMSTLTSTVHTVVKHEARDDNHCDDDSSYDDFAEDSFVRSTATLSTTSEKSTPREEADNSANDEYIAFFELRKTPRGSSRKEPEVEGNRTSVKLTKRPMQLAEMNSLLLHVDLEKASASASVPSNSSLHTSSSRHSISYKSLRSDEKRRIRGRAEMEWMNPSFANNAHLSKQNDKRDDETEQISSLSLPSIHPGFAPTNLSSTHLKISKSSGEMLVNDTVAGSQGVTSDPELHIPQSSLLGAYHDTEREDDDPLLNLGQTPDDTNVRASSEHYIPSMSIRKGLEKKREIVRKSSSEHATKSRTQKANPDRVRGEGVIIPRLKSGTNDTTGNALIASTLNSSIVSKIDKYPVPPVTDSEPAISVTTSCAGQTTTTKGTTKSCKYFDKVTMTWKERKELPKKDMFFDKVEFRWVAKQVNTESKAKVDAAHVLTKDSSQNPFSLDMRKSKALQILKTERHLDFTQQGRSSFRGTSTKRQRRASVNMEQMESAITSRNLLVCIACNVSKRTVLLVPCSHLCLCESCSMLKGHLEFCPLCACKVTSKMVIA